MKAQNVIWAIGKVEQALKQANNDTTKGILLAMLAHYVEDAHQPLHTISHVNAQCQGDKGGNLFCLNNKHSRYYRNNLHHLWDTGVGYLKGRQNFSGKVARLEAEFPRLTLKTQIANTNPESWVRAEYRYAAFIYSTPQGRKPGAAYYRKGQAIARKQIILAGYQLAYILNTQLNRYL